MPRDPIAATAAALVPVIADVATDPRKLKPGELCRLVNSTPLGPVLDDRKLRGHRTRAGSRIGDGRTIDLVRYAGWLAAERYREPPPVTPVSRETRTAAAAAYEQKKEREAARNAAKSAASRELGDLPPCKDPQRRAAAEASLRAWCETYLNKKGWFNLPWSPDLLESAADFDELLAVGGRKLRAMPRGGGKSTLGKAGVLKGALTGAFNFVVLIGAIMRMGRRLLADVKHELLTNDLLLEDYPEVCVAIRRVGNVANRCKGQTIDGEPTFIEWGKDMVVLPVIPGSRASGCILYAAGLEGAIRGLNVNGKRPKFAFVDDPQTKKSAKSVEQTNARMELLKNDVRGLAGPDEELAIYAAVTVIYPGDLADQLLDPELSPDWEGKRGKLLYAFPDDFTRERTSESRDNDPELWKEYARIRRLRKDAGGDGQAEATEFYLAHREAMDAGAAVGWDERKTKTHVSALQFAMDLFFDDPAYFWREMQNEPKFDEGQALVDIDAKQLRFRNNGLKRGVIPQATTHLVAHVDVQHDSLWWGALACHDEIGGVFVYGCWPKQRTTYFTKRDLDPGLARRYPGLSPQGAVEAGLIELLRTLRTGPWVREDRTLQAMELVLVDWSDGDMADVVAKVCRMEEFLGWAMPAAGRGIGPERAPMDTFKVREDLGEKLGFHWLTKRHQKRAISAATVDANFWKSYAANALSCPPSSRTAIVFSGEEHADHRLAADHLTAEVGTPLTSDKNGRKVTVWTAKPNRDNEHFDNLYNCCAAASMRGCTVNGSGVAPKKRRKKLSDEQRKRRG